MPEFTPAKRLLFTVRYVKSRGKVFKLAKFLVVKFNPHIPLGNGQIDIFMIG